MTIKVIDLFSGPGGLGEGFASLGGGKAFQISVSAEMESSAHSTLTLRAFFRLGRSNGDKKAEGAYYDFCNSPAARHPSEVCPELWALAKEEARQLTLGDNNSNIALERVLSSKKLDNEYSVLIGGPPCQAYSIVGRSRNVGKSGYKPEEDHRHFLYREYLRILARTRPTVFVMENVRGILSSSVGGRQIFDDILVDLRDPVRATSGKRGPRYAIHALTRPTKFDADMQACDVQAKDFIVQAEKFGVPQARHRVILLGVREDVDHSGLSARLSPAPQQVLIEHAIRELPKLRSKLSRNDSSMAWRDTVIALARRFAKEADHEKSYEIARRLDSVTRSIKLDLPTGSLRMDKEGVRPTYESRATFDKWISDEKVDVWLNHESRSHMDSDLGRYLYASVFAELHRRTPKGHLEFPFKGLAPAHANWESGKFIDRFRVQRYGAPSTTVTSHISKDGHYFIHPDPAQCRSLTVREAARLQTFPDNYFFQGNRTQQYHQVGNAVPPLLARQIAEIVRNIVSGQP